MAVGPFSLILNGYWGSVQKVMWPERAVNHSSAPSADVKKEWSYTSAPPSCLHGVDRQNFTFTVTVPFPPHVLTVWGVTKLRTHFTFTL
jgi:hypothetical protein